MATPLAKALLAGRKPVFMMPCTVVTLAPFRVDLGDGTPIPATKIQGQTYTVGAAIAFLNSSDLPVVLAIG